MPCQARNKYVVLALHPAAGWYTGANSVSGTCSHQSIGLVLTKILSIDFDGYSVITYTQYTPHRRNPDRLLTPKPTRVATPEVGPSFMESPQVVDDVELATNCYAALLSGVEGDENEIGEGMLFGLV